VVLLGASNLLRGISTVVETAELVWQTPLDVMAACGHGRSYGMTSWVLGRSLPGIIACGLWEDLSRRPRLPTSVLVTDIGNDLVYGANVDQIAAWIECCLERVTPLSDRLVVTQLPLESLARLAPWRFRLLRTILFPRSKVKFHDVMAGAQQLNARVLELAKRFGAVVGSVPQPWFGWDLIHIKRRHWSRAWHEILSGWRDDKVSQRARGSLIRWLTLRSQRPLDRRWFGREQHRAQPTCVLRSGSVISFY
jgi:hypothetical protein